MIHLRQKSDAFSLVEVTFALGVAAFCLIAVLGLVPVAHSTQQASIRQSAANGITSQIIGDLRAAFRKPGNNSSSQFGVGLKKFPPGLGQKYTPDPLYFDITGTQQNGSAGAVYKATITYYSTTDATSTLADIIISWPAEQADLTKAAGFTDTLAIIDRALP
jgi:uncharacterized protein (TIGR02598 family)